MVPNLGDFTPRGHLAISKYILNLQLGGRILLACGVEARDAAKDPPMLMAFPTMNYPAHVSVLLRLRNPDVMCNLNYSIMYPQAKEKVWSYPNLKEMAPVKGKRTLVSTGNSFKRPDTYE